MGAIADRLREERDRLGLSQAAFAALAGQSKKSQGRYEAGERSPDTAYLSALVEKGVDVQYVVTGKRNPHLPDTTAPLQGDVRIADQDYNTVRVFEVDAAAGTGIVPSTEAAPDQIAFTRTWLMQHDLAADLAGLVRVRGDSMMPTIPDGAYVLIDFRARADWSTPGIYIVRVDDAVMVKRIQVSQDPAVNWVALISDNPAHHPVLIHDVELSRFQPIGRVRAVITSV